MPFEHSQTVPHRDITIGEREKAILLLFKKGHSLPFREIFARLFPPISERQLRYDLAQLKEKGALISKGKGRATVWGKTL